ncbi:MAG TPA: Tex family protein [Bryobacteraceae bacterium]|nr:Tex family protein [Bryobacteraceae bacterium]
MMDTTSLNPNLLLHIAQELNISLRSLVSTIELLDDKSTVPFIARYRKEVTGNLDEVQIRAIEEKLGYFRELEDRRKTVLQSIAEQGKLTPELRERIEATLEKNELEDLYLPFKPKRRTKASIARDKGLEPLAHFLWDQQPGPLGVLGLAATFVSEEKGVPSAGDALAGAGHIVAEWISENADFRKNIRQMMLEHGTVVTRGIEGAPDPEGKYKLYLNYTEAAAKIPSHRMLAVRRGAREGVLNFEIELASEMPVTYLKNKVIREQGEWVPYLEAAVQDSYDRLINPSIQTEVRLELKDRSDEEAIRVFKENLENVLLASPAGMLTVLAVDPGLRTGCKLAVVDDTGKFLEDAVIYPLEPRNDLAGSVQTLAALIKKHNVRSISIGNGTGSREASAFIRDFLQQAGLRDVFSVVVNESGASVYSASDIARQEFPNLDLTVRGAISIARRLQDPLAELVKIDPKSIGVGQYQHDVDQRKLMRGLESTVESCVNRVGVDLNTASFALLRYVAGINERTAQKIVEYRNEHGRFRSRVQLTAIPGFGPKTFEQAAGFLRIRGGDNPLDMTGVHPESYMVVQRIASSLNVAVPELIAKPELIEQIKIEGFQTEAVGIYTLTDIREELRKPGRDPREKFVAPQWRDDVKTIADLTPGMIVEGTVTNVTAFGAFVDIGVHQDGLIHVSEISSRFIKEPAEAVKAGQIIKAKVLAADPKARRISLSIKALEERAPARPREQKRQAPPPPKKPSFDEQMAKLSERFRTR